MRRAPLALGALLVSVSPALIVSELAYAQTTPSPPTTIDVKSSTVERNVTVPTIESAKVTTPTVADTNNSNDGDSDKTGLWGLAGLLGLLGLAGLAGRKKRDDDGVRPSGATITTSGATGTRPPTTGTSATGIAPPKAEGATGRNP